MTKNKRNIKGYMVFDAYDIKDIYGSYTVTFKMYNKKSGKFLGLVKF